MNAAIGSYQNLFLDLFFQRQGQTSNIMLQTPAPCISQNIRHQSPVFVQGRNKDKGNRILSHLLAFFALGFKWMLSIWSIWVPRDLAGGAGTLPEILEGSSGWRRCCWQSQSSRSVAALLCKWRRLCSGGCGAASGPSCQRDARPRQAKHFPS